MGHYQINNMSLMTFLILLSSSDGLLVMYRLFVNESLLLLIIVCSQGMGAFRSEVDPLQLSSRRARSCYIETQLYTHQI